MKIPEGSFMFRLTPKRSLIAALVAAALTFLTVKCDISQENLLKLYNEIRRTLKINLPQDNEVLKEIDNQLNEKINNNQKLLDFKIKREVDSAISKYENLTGDNKTVKLPSPIFSELPVDESVCYTKECKSLGGEIRLCAPWVEDCPKNNQQ
jgi:hypothetical protein